MKTTIKTAASAVLFSLLISMASSSFAEDYYYGDDDQVREGDIIVDLFVARPLGLVGSALGLVTHGIGLLFSVPGENFSETAEVLVEDPLRYTFNRPLGRFDEHR